MIALDTLDRRIAASLLADGRASWRRIALALGEPERSIARRGRRLLDDGIVRVVSFSNPFAIGLQVYTIRVRVAPSELDRAAQALAQCDNVTTTSILASLNEVFCEAAVAPDALGEFISECIVGLPGLMDYRIDPALRFHRTASGWRPDALDTVEIERLGSPDEHADLVGAPVEMDAASRSLIAALDTDGRATAESVARTLGVSKVTVGGWIDRAVGTGQMFVRGVVSPAILGYPVEAIVRLRPPIHEIDDVAAALAENSLTRVCAVDGATISADMLGRDARGIQLAVADVTRAFPHTTVEIDFVRETLKRSGIIFEDDRPVGRPTMRA